MHGIISCFFIHRVNAFDGRRSNTNLYNKNLIILLSNYIQIRFRNNLENDLSVLMLESYMKRPYTFFLETNSGEILRGVNSDISGVAQVVDGFFCFF